MRKYTLIFWVALCSCSPTTSITKNENANLSNACKIVHIKKKQLSIGLTHEAHKYRKKKTNENTYTTSRSERRQIPVQNNQPFKSHSLYRVKQYQDTLLLTSRPLVIEHQKLFGLEKKSARSFASGRARQVSRVSVVKSNFPEAKEKKKFLNGALPMLALAAIALLGAGLFRSSEKKIEKIIEMGNKPPHGCTNFHCRSADGRYSRWHCARLSVV